MDLFEQLKNITTNGNNEDISTYQILCSINLLISFLLDKIFQYFKLDITYVIVLLLLLFSMKTLSKVMSEKKEKTEKKKKHKHKRRE
jgi:hypothetical protein